VDAPLPGPGRYRTEVFLRQPGILGGRRWTLWIFSNPTYVTSVSGRLNDDRANSKKEPAAKK
jgi:hypothetical protein